MSLRKRAEEAASQMSAIFLLLEDIRDSSRSRRRKMGGSREGIVDRHNYRRFCM